MINEKTGDYILNGKDNSIPQAWGFCKGELVQVRSSNEILATLDADGTLDKLPFMPEMLDWCGKQLCVTSRAHKLCDTIHNTGARYMPDAVHLDGVRCSGEAHGGCEANCLIVWKEAWLKPVDPLRKSRNQSTAHCSCSVENLHSLTQPEPNRYSCQATQLYQATQTRRYWDLRTYWEDWRSGNEQLGTMFIVFILRLLHVVLCRLGRGYRLTVGLYNRIARVKDLPPFPYRTGMLQGKTPQANLNLQPGELVRVKSHDEILKTLAGWKNRGMRFDPEMVPWCGRIFRVHKRLQRVINEQTGDMISLKNDCIVLEGPFCTAFHSNRRLFCSRAIIPFWREIWLERVMELPQRKPASDVDESKGSIADGRGR